MENNKSWTDESSVSFTKLVNVVPADKCVILKQDGSWEIVDCTQPKYVVCKRGERTPELLTRYLNKPFINY